MSDDLKKRAEFVLQLFREVDAIQLPHRPTEEVITGLLARITALEEEVGMLRGKLHLAGSWHDEPDDMTPEVKADFGTEGFYDRYAEALELVSNRHSKSALVSLVCLLLKDRAALAGGE